MTIRLDAMFAGTLHSLGPRAVPGSIVRDPIAGPWQIKAMGLVGDVQTDTSNHGGPDKALHHYPA